MINDLLSRQSMLLDSIIQKQISLHDYVLKKDWHSAQAALLALEKMQESFVVLDGCREEMSQKNAQMNASKTKDLLLQVKSKLVKSKILNESLNSYLSTVGDFTKSMLDKVVPQRKNKTYGCDGHILEAKPASFVVNAFC